jgi:hypothetical protein
MSTSLRNPSDQLQECNLRLENAVEKAACLADFEELVMHETVAHTHMFTTHMKTQNFHCKERFLEHSLDPENTLERVFSTTRAIKCKDVKRSCLTTPCTQQ